jgi:hypothetical protein
MVSPLIVFQQYAVICVQWQVNPHGDVPSTDVTQVSTVVTPPAPAAQISAQAYGSPARQM